MVKTWDKLDKALEPSKEIIDAYMNNPIWNSLCAHIEDTYQSRPVIEYSGCSMQAGWNVKYKKSGRGLCTLYPMEGYFIVLIVIGERERLGAEELLPVLSGYLQKLYIDTKTGMGQKWLMIEVTDDDILEDVKKLIKLRRGVK